MEKHFRHILSVTDLHPEEIKRLIHLTQKVKKNPKKYTNYLKAKTAVMIFQAPSLRTRMSFEIGMNQLGGNALNYDLQSSPLSKGKETIEDSSRVISRYADVVIARLYNTIELERFSHVSSIPVINAMTDLEHPCQVFSDLFTIYEHHKNFKNLKLSYVGDSNNNVTHSLLLGCASVGMDIALACPNKKEFMPDQEILKKARTIGNTTGADIEVHHTPEKAVKEADIVYTDSWMSYHIDPSKHVERVRILKPFQVNKKLLKQAQDHALFMHCLPAQRGEEVTDDVLDGKQSIVLDQAENRLHTQKALLIGLI